MACISPLRLKLADVWTDVPCGKCNFCLSARRADWSFRLKQELKTASSASFLTLTYEEEKMPRASTGFATLCKKDLQLFTKRLRKLQQARGGPGLRYYSVGEYGTKGGRPHYHSIMFNMVDAVRVNVPLVWGYGHCVVGSVTPASIHYVTKYVINRDYFVGDGTERDKPFSVMSTRPGLGSAYWDRSAKWHKDNSYVVADGFKQRLPRYFKDKIELTEAQEARVKDDQWIVKHYMDVDYWDEVARLSKFHPDPEGYYEQRLRAALDGIVSKENESNQF